MFFSLDCFSGEKYGDIECRHILCKNERKFDGFMLKSLGGCFKGDGLPGFLVRRVRS